MTSSAPSSTQYRVCRFARSPMMVLAVVLLYGLMLALRQRGEAAGLMALRGATSEGSTTSPPGDEEETLTREEIEVWDPLPDNHRDQRGPVKGGVEIYPMQSTRRKRESPKPLVPEVAEIEGTLTAWHMPEEYVRGGGEAMKGLYVLFHGCNHGPLDWFDLPEERAIVHTLVNSGYAVVAPASQDRVSGCWKYNSADGDINPVKAVLWRWYRDWSISPTTPLFLFGASSGGNMATLMASRGGFQLCDKRTTYVQVSGVMSQVSWGIPPGSYGKSCPPIGFMPMPKGEVDSGDMDDPDVPPVFGNSRKIPSQISSIAHHVRKSGGRPRMLLLPVGELSLFKEFFSDRVYEISPSQSGRLYNALLASHAMKCEPGKLVDGEQECFLAANPREGALALEALVATYMASLGESDNSSGNADVGSSTAETEEGASSAVEGSQRLLNRRQQDQAAASGPLPILQPESDGYDHQQRQQQEEEDEKRVMTEHHATEVFRELLNVAWGAHEVTGEFVSLWERWLWDSCGGNCRPWPSR